MKKIFLINLLFIFSAVCAFAQPVRLATFDNPPLEFEENGEIRGVIVEIVREVFSRMNRDIEIRVFPFKRALEHVKDGKVDAIFTFFKNPAREKFVDYSETVLFSQTTSLFVMKNASIVFDGDLSKLEKYRLGTVRGFSYGELFDNAVKSGSITNIDMAKDLKHNIMKFTMGRFDILVSNKYGAIDLFRKMKLSEKIKILAPPLQNIPSYIAFSKKRNLISLKDEFDRILTEMKNDGSYDRIISSYFGLSN